MRSPVARFAARLGLAASLACPAWAQLPAARLQQVFPAGGKIGSAFRVTVAGPDLEHAAALHFSHGEIIAKKGTNEAQFEVTIGTNVPPGIYEARVAGRFGISNARAFAVGSLAEGIESEGCDSPSKAMPIEVGTTVNGRANASAFDFFKFAGGAQEVLVIDCEAEALDSPMQPVVTLLDAAGRELARSRNGAPIVWARNLKVAATGGGDGTVRNLKVAATGGVDGKAPLLLKVHDLLFRGGADYVYRLTVSARPQIDFVMPPSIAAGSKAKVRFYGRNLPGGEPAPEFEIGGQPLQWVEREIQAPEAGAAAARRWRLRGVAAGMEGFEHRLEGPGGISNPARIALALAPVRLECECEEEALDAALPCEMTGQLYPSADLDRLQFRASKGEKLWLEVFANRMGLPVSPFLLVQKVTGEKGAEKLTDLQEVYPSDANIGGPRFPMGTLDPQWKFVVPEDGEYRVTIRNLFSTAPSDPANVYRLVIRREAPDFALIAMAQTPPSQNKEAREARPWSSLIRKGDVLPIEVLVMRQHDFGGPVELLAEGLPQGVRAARSIVPAGSNRGQLFLVSDAEAPAWAGVIRVLGRAKLGDAEVTREARGGQVLWEVPDWNNQAAPTRLTHELALAVSGFEPGPIRIGPAEEKTWEAAAGAKLSVPLKVAHAAGFQNAARFKPAGHPALDAAPDFEISGTATNAVLELDLSQSKLPEGLHTVHLFGYAKGQHRRLTPEEVKALEAEGAKAAEKLKTAEVTTPVWSAPITIKVNK